MPKLKRRRYGDDVVIYTKEEGHIMTIPGKHFPDPWVTAQVILQTQEVQYAQTCDCGVKDPLVAEFGQCGQCMDDMS